MYLTFSSCECSGVLAKAAEYGIGEGLEKPFVPVEDFLRETGKGIKCIIDGHVINIGNRACLEVNDIEIRPGTHDAMEYLEDRGRTAIALAIDGKTEAVLGLIDTAKDEAAFTVNILQKAMGIKVMMVNGDNIRTARVVAADIGIAPENIVAGALPEEKVDCIRRLQGEGECVGSIGDGTNDSPGKSNYSDTVELRVSHLCNVNL